MRITILAAAAAASLAVISGFPTGAAAEPAVAPKPPFRLPAGTTVRVLGTNIACQTIATRRLISCFRLTRRGRKLVEVPGGYGFVMKGDGDVLVNRLRGRRWIFEFGRVTAAVSKAPPIFHARPNDQFWVPRSRIVCQIAVDRIGRRRVPAIQCAFVDAQDRFGAPQSYGAGLSSSGKAYVVRFTDARRPVIVFDSSKTSGTKTVQVDTSSNVFVGLGVAGRAIKCGGVLIRGLKAMTCGALSGTTESQYSFGLVEDGTIAVFRRTGGENTAVYVRAGNRLGNAQGPDQATASGPSFNLGSGEYFKLAGTRIVCQITGSGAQTITHCGLPDRQGLGAPRSHTVAIRADGTVAVLRWDRSRRGVPVYRSP